MGLLTDDMKRVVGEQRLGFVATSNPTGRRISGPRARRLSGTMITSSLPIYAHQAPSRTSARTST